MSRSSRKRRGSARRRGGSGGVGAHARGVRTARGPHRRSGRRRRILVAGIARRGARERRGSASGRWHASAPSSAVVSWSDTVDFQTLPSRRAPGYQVPRRRIARVFARRDGQLQARARSQLADGRRRDARGARRRVREQADPSRARGGRDPPSRGASRELPADGAPRDVALLHPECALASEASGSRDHLPRSCSRSRLDQTACFARRDTPRSPRVPRPQRGDAIQRPRRGGSDRGVQGVRADGRRATLPVGRRPRGSTPPRRTRHDKPGTKREPRRASGG